MICRIPSKGIKMRLMACVTALSFLVTGCTQIMVATTIDTEARFGTDQEFLKSIDRAKQKNVRLDDYDVQQHIFNNTSDDRFKTLVDSGLIAHTEIKYAIHAGVISGQHGKTKMLLDIGVNPNRVGGVDDLDQSMAEFFQHLVRFSSVVEPGTPLTFAAHAGDIKSIKMLIDSGAFVDYSYKGNYYKSPLMHAIEQKHLNAAEYLLVNGAEVNRVINKEAIFAQVETPLLIAVKQKNLEAAKLLIEHGAFVMYEDGLPQPLEIARKNKDESMQDLLITHGARAELKRKDKPIKTRLASGGKSTWGDVVEVLVAGVVIVGGIALLAAAVESNSRSYSPSISPPFETNRKSHQEASSLIQVPTSPHLDFGCLNDFQCPTGQRCVKKSSSSELRGICGTIVNKFGNRTVNSYLKSTDQTVVRSCYLSTDCPIGFECRDGYCTK